MEACTNCTEYNAVFPVERMLQKKAYLIFEKKPKGKI